MPMLTPMPFAMPGPPGPRPTSEWSTSIVDFALEPDRACVAVLCPCVMYGWMNELLPPSEDGGDGCAGNCFGACCLYGSLAMVPCVFFICLVQLNAQSRRRTREIFNIPEATERSNGLNDFKASCCLMPCAILQQLRHLEDMGCGVHGKRGQVKHGHYIKPVFQANKQIVLEPQVANTQQVTTPIWYRGRVPAGSAPVGPNGQPIGMMTEKHRRMLANPPPAPSTASAPLTVPVSGIHFGSDTPVAANTMDE
eukprot:Tamp_13342.p1 GENE.Tamp_13342~~Tamp_13342.p1  ORF type:complete len:252 (+),score=21.83 Tamp_13342:934-1689(+)